MKKETRNKKIKQAKENLADPYRSALQNFDVTGAIKDVAQNHNLNRNQKIELDREVTYLLLQMQSSVDFMERLNEKIDLPEQKISEIAQAVTDKIIRPLQEKMEQSDTQEEMPVPEPPTKNGDTPTPEYGGNTDPYREPAE